MAKEDNDNSIKIFGVDVSQYKHTALLMAVLSVGLVLVVLLVIVHKAAQASQITY